MWELVSILLFILSMVFSFFHRKESLFWIIVILTCVAMGAFADILRSNYLGNEVMVGGSQLAVIFVLFNPQRKGRSNAIIRLSFL